MKSSDETLIGPYVSYITGPTGGSGSGSTSYVASGRKLFHVENGLVSGDRKTPNPVFYRKLTTPPGSLGRHWWFGERGQLNQFFITSADPGPQATETGFNVDVNSDAALDRALEKILNQIRGQSNLIVDIAERNATVKMLKDTLLFQRRLKSFLKRTKRSRQYKRIRGPKAAARQADFIASKWLEYRYGWLPLVHSVYDLLDEIHRHRAGGYIRVGSRSSSSSSKTVISGKGTDGAPYRQFSTERSYRVEYGIFFQLPPGSALWDYTQLNPAAIAWELVPFSFVADWFVNVGDTLKLWEDVTIFSQYFKGGYRTVTDREVRKGSVVGQDSANIQYVPGTAPPQVVTAEYGRSRYSSGSTIYVEKRRIRLTSLPRPAGFRIRFELNSKRIADAAALIWQQFRR